MNVLLTGASGFVGSHILDRLVERHIPTAVLLRPTSNRRFIDGPLDRVRVVEGSVTHPASLPHALAGVTHVIHCAGATKTVRAEELHTVNHVGTRNLVQAVNVLGPQIRRFVHVSSLAVSGPGTRANPAREDAPPHPVSEYGRSKLAGELEVTRTCRAPFFVLRPAAVYGPRDAEWLRLFKAASHGWAPVFSGGRQELSLAFVRDLAQITVDCLEADIPTTPVFHVASADIVTARQLIEAIAGAFDRTVRILPLPNAVLPPLCVLAQAWARVAGRATILAHGKRHELTAPGWVADVRRLETGLGTPCRTSLDDGVRAALEWYRRQHWL